VIDDFKTYESALKARSAGTNFYGNLGQALAGGKSFAQAALAAGQTPVALKPFSLSSREVPEAAERGLESRQVIAAAAQTQPGHVSPFVPTTDGGLVLFVQSMLPVDESRKATEMPKFLEQLRRSRLNEAFNRWLFVEENRELASTPVPKEVESERSSAGRP
jgi:hypothetical protein